MIGLLAVGEAIAHLNDEQLFLRGMAVPQAFHRQKCHLQKRTCLPANLYSLCAIEQSKTNLLVFRTRPINNDDFLQVNTTSISRCIKIPAHCLTLISSLPLALPIFLLT